jgi:hypothetical protein
VPLWIQLVCFLRRICGQRLRRRPANSYAQRCCYGWPRPAASGPPFAREKSALCHSNSHAEHIPLFSLKLGQHLDCQLRGYIAVLQVNHTATRSVESSQHKCKLKVNATWPTASSNHFSTTQRHRLCCSLFTRTRGTMALRVPCSLRASGSFNCSDLQPNSEPCSCAEDCFSWSALSPSAFLFH